MKPKFRRFLLVPLCVFSNLVAISQTTVLSKKIVWTEGQSGLSTSSNGLHCIASQQDLPLFHYSFPIPAGSNFDVNLKVISVKTSQKSPSFLSQLTEDFEVSKSVRIFSKKNHGTVNIIPVRINKTGQFEYAEQFELEIKERAERENISGNSSYKREGKITSKLNSGKWFKITLEKSGICKIDHRFLTDNGIDPSSFDARKMAIYGYGGKALPEIVSDDVQDDAEQIPTFRSGLDDGKFDNNDYLLFYGQGPITWQATSDASHALHKLHPYSDQISYFIHLDTDAPLKPEKESTSGNASYSTKSYDYTFVHHVDHYTDISKHVKTGKEWYGEEFVSSDQTYKVGPIENMLTSENISFRSLIAERHIGGGNAEVDVTINGQLAFTHTMGPVSGKSEDAYAVPNAQKVSTKIGSNILEIAYSYKKPNSQATAWLNYFEVNARVQLKYIGQPLVFRDLKTVPLDGDVIEYSIESSKQDVQVWDITDINDIKSMDYSFSGGSIKFKTKGIGSLREFVIFENNGTITPNFVGKVENQNLHGLPHADAFIVTYKDFKPAADDLAAFHREKEGFTIHVVDIDDVYNEFSSGHQDISAIRNMMSYFYKTAQTDEQIPKYLVLFGDASYDYKNRIPENTNFVPTYQSNNSTHLGDAFATDDYYGLLDNGEGGFNNDGMDLGIGRFPVQTLEEAQKSIQKIKAYYESKTLRPWRNAVSFIADDEDSNLHISQTEDLAQYVIKNHPVYNVQKVYFDSYVQEASAGGSRYPDVDRRINEIMESGTLIINYIGHGGELGWAHERVLELDDINAWKNIDKMPLMVTATCEFTRFDDPVRVSAGEQVFLNPSGGAIAMLTTTRLVYAHENKNILDALFKDNIFDYEGYNFPTIGETIQKTKASFPTLIIGYRKFALIGDPMITLAYPREQVKTTSINGKPVSESSSDTLKALTKVAVEGNITDLSGNVLSNYNGVVYPTIYDKPDTLNTLRNDNASLTLKFGTQKNILYKGKATVTNGHFKFEFVVPKDISYKFGQGKISYYTENGKVDGNGFYTGFVIGGTGDSLVKDEEGPEADLFANDLTFGFGGLTDENPVIIGVLKDDNGINTVGTSIGHELTLKLDDEDPVIVNEYYEAELDDYTSGKVTYPYKNLEEGRHSVTLVAWDIANNSTTAYTEFVVASSAELALEHVLNYPNPFTTNTTFRFDHNKPGDVLDVSVQVFNISGRVVKTLTTQVVTTGSTFSDLTWDGTDDFGNTIGKGVYVYRVQVRSSDGNTAEEIEKLVLLR